MRVSTAFNKMLAIPGAWVAGVDFAPGEVVVTLRRRFRRLRCPCGYSTRARYDGSVRRWRHLDLGGCKLFLQAEIRRLKCPDCGVLTEEVPWARPQARHTRDFEDVCAYLAQRTDRTSAAKLLRCSWDAVSNICRRVVADHLDPARLEGLYRIGVDEVAYRRGHRYLTIVADHDRQGRVVWADDGRNADTLRAFYDALGEEGCAALEAVSLDPGRAYIAATRERAPQATICIDPFHIVQLANNAIDGLRRHTLRTEQRAKEELRSPVPVHKGLRFALLTGSEALTDRQRALLDDLRRSRHVLWRAWVLKEELRDLYRLPDPATAPAYLKRWLARAARSRIPQIAKLAKTIRVYREEILAAVTLGLANSRLEGLASKIRLINHRGYGHHTPAALIAMIYLCCGGIDVRLPWG